MRLDLAWVRTVLVTLAFVWVMVAWHRYDERARVDWMRQNNLIATACSPERADGDAKWAAACELSFRKASGSVDVNGSVDVSGFVDLSH